MEDLRFRKILSDTKLSAGENLKFRIMQQIETENSLVRKKAKGSFSILDNMFSVFGVMYAVIAIAAGIVYFSAGKEAVESSYMYLIVILIVSVCSMFWMISLYDERRRKKNQKK
ncbi:MAG TPA: hypothetical protein DIT04_00020 [Dysgonomonas sp.]|nr:hypothetical protein [Dysgonomonas sp.]